MSEATVTSFRTCPLCEATCGLEIESRDGEVLSVRGDAEDVFSHGFICPKGASLIELEEDSDRLREPMVRHGSEWRRVDWDEAFAEVERGLAPILESGPRDAVAVYLGNPNVHNLDAPIYGRALLKALGSRNVYSASTLDQMPKQVAAGLMFGGGFTLPVPDVDRTNHLLILGANPLVSNGSLLTAPDMRGRLRAIRERGGKVVVIDPRRTRTAEAADEHHFIRPGTDAALLMAMVRTVFEEGLVSTGRLDEHLNGVEAVRELAEPFTPEAVEAVCSIPAGEIRRLTRELAAAERAAVYGRIGTCTQEFGTLASWLVEVLNILTGNFDREGGAMFPRAAAGASNTRGRPGSGRGVQIGRWHSRVRGAPETLAEFPTACLSEEIDTPGEGRVRALLTIAGNPARSAPNSERLEAAMESLEFMVSVDVYLNETTRHANVILPGPSPLARHHYDLAFYQLAVRNIANYSPPLRELEPGAMHEWEILLRLTGIVTGQGPDADIGAIDDFIATQVVQREVTGEGSPVEGRDPSELLAALEPRRGPTRILDMMLRAGPFGDGFGTSEDGLTLDRLEALPHGIDLGPLEPRIPEVLRTPSGKIELAPEPIAADVERLLGSLGTRRNGQMVLVGRRQLRSNNSWMHNLPHLVRGRDTCTLQVNPTDATRLGLADGGTARVTAERGSVEAPVEVTDSVMPGVVSLPHGWGHDAPGVRMSVASDHAGVNSNVLADDVAIDPLSGNAILNGISITIEPVVSTNGGSGAGAVSTLPASG